MAKRSTRRPSEPKRFTSFRAWWAARPRYDFPDMPIGWHIALFAVCSLLLLLFGQPAAQVAVQMNALSAQYPWDATATKLTLLLSVVGVYALMAAIAAGASFKVIVDRITKKG